MDKKKWNAVFYVSITLCILSLIAGMIIYFSMCATENDYEKLRSETKSTQQDGQLGEINSDGGVKINFDNLQKRNKDIYAWITIPQTGVDYPVLQSYEEDDDFYLNHNLDREWDINGSIYTEKHNSLDFTDPVTVIYGHEMLDGSMFNTLHKFSDKEFFEKNKYIYIYLPDKVLTYTIVSAYKSDDRHILNSYDFSKKEVFEDYLEGVMKPKSMMENHRKIELTTDDRIITLSTCMGNEKNYRYLVQGVLTDERPVK